MTRREQIEQMLTASPDDVFLSFALAMEYLKEGRQEEAVLRLARLVEIDPNYVAAYSQWSNALISLGRREEARTVLARGVEAAERAKDRHAAGKMRDALSLLQ